VKKKFAAEALVASAWAAVLATTITPDKVPPGWHTLRQIAVKLGKAESTIGAQLSRAVREGRAETQSFRINTGKVVRPVPHYRLK
jgi:hypothetical protein